MDDDLIRLYQQFVGPDVVVRREGDGVSVDARDDANPVCNFCSDRPAPYVMGASNVKIDAVPLESTSIGDWAACATCKRLIETDDRKALLSHSASRLRVRHPEVPLEMARTMIWKAHKAFFKARLRRG